MPRRPKRILKTEMANVANLAESSSVTSENSVPHLKKNGSFYTPHMEDKVRRKLKYYFMDPCQKWKARKRFPWKMILQIFKIIVITIQLIMFASVRSAFVSYVEKSTLSMKHLYLQDWDSSYETMPYPPATGMYALYSTTELYSHMNFLVKQHKNTGNLSLGTFILDTNNTSHDVMDSYVTMCKSMFKIGELFPNGTFLFDSKVISSCFEVYPVKNQTSQKYEFDIEEFLQNINETLDFYRLLEIEMKFSVTTVKIDADAVSIDPECYRINVTIVYANHDRDGQMLVTLDTEFTEKSCRGKVVYDSKEQPELYLFTSYDSVVIFLCFISGVLCLRSMMSAHKLKQEVVIFFNNRFGKTLSVYDQLEFLNLWYVLIVINDIFTIVGSSLKIQLENRETSSSSKNYDICSLLLGFSNMLVWFGVLRYLGFFEKYNILILTLKKAFPSIARFSVCALVLYFGFMFCGWLVLGPYHIKFRELSSTSECLYSLINGDDMFVTFSATITNNLLIWYFSRAYLYIFISLFIYIVLSLFISVIMDTYDTVKHCNENGFPRSDLMEFIDSCTDQPSDPIYMQESHRCDLFGCCNCFGRNNADTPNEHTGLIN